MSWFARLVIGTVAVTASATAAIAWLAVENVEMSAIVEFLSGPLFSATSEAVIEALLIGAVVGIAVAVVMRAVVRFPTRRSGSRETAQIDEFNRQQPLKNLEHDAASRIEQLSSRELEVFRYLVGGLANKEIARELQISPRTVEIHRGNLMRKLAVRNMVQLAQTATLCGIEPLHPTK